MKYIVTGVLVNGRRFPALRYSSIEMARSINLYRGTRWAECETNEEILGHRDKYGRLRKRIILERVFN